MVGETRRTNQKGGLAFSFPAFVKGLRGKKAKPTRVSYVEVFEAQVGHRLSADMTRLIMRLTELEECDRVGQIFFFPRKDWPAFAGPSEQWAPTLFKKELFTLVGLFTDSVCISSDGAGDLYFASLGARNSEVFAYAHATMQMGFIAGSIASFAQLNQLDQYASDYISKAGLDVGELHPSTLLKPPLSGIRAAYRGLKGVSVPVREFGTDFDWNVRPVAGVALKAKAQGPTKRLYERAEWLITLLFAGTAVKLEQAQKRRLEKDLADPEIGKLAATKLYWLWHLYVFARDEELAWFAESLNKEKSELVCATARMLVSLSGGQGVPSALASFVGARNLVQEQLGRARRPAPSPASKRSTRSDKKTRVRDWAEAFFSSQRVDGESFASMLAWLRQQVEAKISAAIATDEDYLRMGEVIARRHDLALAELEDLFALADEISQTKRKRIALQLYLHLLDLPLPRSGDKRTVWLQIANNATILAYEEGELATSRQIFERAERHAPENPYLYHSAACTFVALHQLDRAIECIRRAVKHEYEHLDLLKKDRDLRPCLARPDVKAMLAGVPGKKGQKNGR